MYAAEVLSQLRSLNWMREESQRVPAGSSEAGLLQVQVESLRSRLPQSILSHHDTLTSRGQPSVVPVDTIRCGACRHPLPAALLRELSAPGHFAVCPDCGVFLWQPAPPAPASPS